MKPKRKKRKVVAVAKRAVKKTSRVKATPRKKRKAKMTIKKPIDDDEPDVKKKSEPKPEATKEDPMGKPPDSPINPNLPQEPAPEQK